MRCKTVHNAIKHQDALNLILSKIFPREHSIVTGDTSVSSEPAGGQTSTSSLQANSLNASIEAGGSDRAAGNGS
jgi:hypothetical protein